jgi:hypothetical protein
MRTQYYQVTGRGPWTIDYPGGDTKAHRPGQIVGPIAPTNKGVVRGLRSKRLRKLSDREANALRNAAQVASLKPLAAAETKAKSAPVYRDETPIVIVDDQPDPIK